MRARGKSAAGAFSLVEVVIAVGVAGISLVVLLGLLASVSREAGQAVARHTALTLADATAVELTALARQAGFDAFAATVPVRSAVADAGLLLVAARDGTQVRRLEVAENPRRDAYFLIEVNRFADGALRFVGDAGAMAVQVRVSWPYRPLVAGGSGEAVPAAERERVEFSVAVNR